MRRRAPRGRGLGFLLAAALVAATTACDRPSAETAEVDAPDDSAVVAEVDDTRITEADLDAQIQAMASRGDRPEREAALEERIDLALLAAQAEREDVHRQPETAAELRRQRAMLLARHLIQARIDALDIGDSELRSAYDDYVAAADERREYKVRHILVDSRERARTLVERIRDGADFGELAREHSQGPSAERGGRLDWFRGDQMVPAFADAVAELEREEFTREPVETRFGWHVILLDDVRDNEAESFDEMRDDLRDDLRDERIRALLRDLRERADIELR